MNLSNLVNTISDVHKEFQSRAKSAINISLTIRNWVIGYYIVEYEQNGEDRARYGDMILKVIVERINIKGLSLTNLKLDRQFYLTFPQIGQSLNDQLVGRLFFQVETNLQTKNKKSHSLTDQIQLALTNPLRENKFPGSDVKLARHMIQSLSFTHIALILPLDSELKQVFYIVEAIKGVWSVRELKRQINSLYFERSGLSVDKAKLSWLANQDAETDFMVPSLRNPMVFEFLDLPTTETLEESQLEKALMDNLQQFLLELGNGFCFEARQKRILIDDEYNFIDLVFYHRVLKCHVLIDLKSDAFNHENIGQLNVYLQYFKDKVMQADDNPPIGILLCTASKPQMVRYALADRGNILVNEYKLQLPSEDELQRFIEAQLDGIDK